METEVLRPSISQYSDPVEIMGKMLAYRRKNQSSFSVMKESQNIYRLSPTLITLILQKKRKITLDRVDGIAKLIGLTSAEKAYFRSLVLKESGGFESGLIDHPSVQRRKDVSHHILSDWLHPYVKDCFHISAFQKNPDMIYQYLGAVASVARIKRSYQFLLKEGHLRKNELGRTVVESNLTVTESPIPSKSIRRFHKAALKIAQQALELHSPNERFANSLLLNLSTKRYLQLLQIMNEFAETLKNFSEIQDDECERLYQISLNVSPVGGKIS